MVTEWLAEQRKHKAPLTLDAEVVTEPLPAKSLSDALWHTLTLVGTPSLWPAAMQALWLGEPVWPHLQRQGKWFQVVEAVLLDVTTSQVLAKAGRPWCRVSAIEPALDTLLRVPLANDAQEKTHGTASGQHVTVLVGRQSRLAVRVLGYPPAELRQALQSICFEADALLEEPMAASLNKQRLIQPLVQRALFWSGPKAAPWDVLTATRSLMVVGLVVAGSIGWAVKQELQWQHDIALLDAEPGIKVTASWQRWGIREIEGLHDLSAADPAAVLRRQGQTLGHVDLKLDTVVYQESLIVEKP
jgi:hypothetical protein